MVKRDLNIWSFVENKPKKINRISDYPNHGTIIGYNNTATFTNTIAFGGNVTITDGMDNNRVYISDLTVQGSAEIPPSQGQLRYNTDTNLMEVYLQNEWVELIHPLTKKSKWTRFKNFFKKLLA